MLTRETYKNSLGMLLVPIESGNFQMGQADGDPDERPVHAVHITRAFHMSSTQVTNAQYEQFDPDHKALRGLRGFSVKDDEAVVNVSWHEATAFCEWLTKKEGRPYRLATEAEWEYACRAGTTTPFNTGDEFPRSHHRHQVLEWNPKLEWNLKPVSLNVAVASPNGWGLFDMHGNVEEWCMDWYGPYESGEQTNPVGRSAGMCRVTRGGSHNTPVKYLRSANRSAAIPEDKHWRIGFRVVVGEMPSYVPTPPCPPPKCMQNVRQELFDWNANCTEEPCFTGPDEFIVLPEHDSDELIRPFNHCPAITWCDNGDLLAIWFSTVHEKDREMVILGSRLRRGASQWEPASLFFDVADRNLTGSALLNNGHGKLFHFNGVETGETWAALALVMRTSIDNGATWSHPELINPNHQPRNQVIAATMMTREGYIIQPCDAIHHNCGGTAIHISRDGGKTWTDPGAGTDKPIYAAGNSGCTIAGIHASVVQLSDGRLMALGRGNSRLGRDDNIADSSPISYSSDWGKTWSYHSSPFGIINSGQRSVLMHLQEGPLLVISFTDPKTSLENPKGLTFTDFDGCEYQGYGMYAALSYDKGNFWPMKKLLTPGGAPRICDGKGWTREFLLDDTHAEPRGYLAATQTPDGMIQLISSGLHYSFNLPWLETPSKRTLDCHAKSGAARRGKVPSGATVAKECS